MTRRVRRRASGFALGVACTAVAGAMLVGACGDGKRAAPRTSPIEDELAARSPAQGGLEFERWAALDLGDRPYRLNARLKYLDGRIDSAVVVTMRSRDSTVVRAIDGALVPTGVGRTTVGVASGELKGLVFVSVSARIATDTVALNPGEVRAWDLTPGTYEITVHHQRDDGRPSPLELVADLKCATDARRPDVITCLVRVPTRFVLRHTGVRPTPGGARAVVGIVQVP